MAATPEMNAGLRAWLAQLLGEYDQVRRDATALRERLGRASGIAAAEDGSVRVTVGPRGELRSLEIGPRAYRRLSPSDLAAEILGLTRRATEEVRRELEQVMKPLLPEGSTYDDLISTGDDQSPWSNAAGWARLAPLAEAGLFAEARGTDGVAGGPPPGQQ